MKYYILLLLFIGSQCKASKLIMCATSATKYEKETIISNIRYKKPNLNDYKLREIFIEVLLCTTGSRESNSLTDQTFYRTIYRIIFKNESDLTAIHKGYCNSGKKTGIEICSSSLGQSYPCSALMDSFGPCSNDYNFDDGL